LLQDVNKLAFICFYFSRKGGQRERKGVSFHPGVGGMENIASLNISSLNPFCDPVNRIKED
jgi:hypothetical protein